MAVVEANKALARGGYRPGAGRPALPEGERKERVVLYLRPGAAAALRKFQEVNSGPGCVAWDKMLQWHLEDFIEESNTD